MFRFARAHTRPSSAASSFCAGGLFASSLCFFTVRHCSNKAATTTTTAACAAAAAAAGAGMNNSFEYTVAGSSTRVAHVQHSIKDAEGKDVVLHSYFYLGAAAASEEKEEGKNISKMSKNTTTRCCPTLIVDLSPSMTDNRCAGPAKQAIVDTASLFQKAAAAGGEGDTDDNKSNNKMMADPILYVFSSNVKSASLSLAEPSSWMKKIEKMHSQLTGSTAPETAFDALLDELERRCNEKKSSSSPCLVPITMSTDGEFNARDVSEYPGYWQSVAGRMERLEQQHGYRFCIRVIGVINDDPQHLSFMRRALPNFSYTTVVDRSEISRAFNHAAEMALSASCSQVRLRGSGSGAAASAIAVLYDKDVVVSAQELHTAAEAAASSPWTIETAVEQNLRAQHILQGRSSSSSLVADVRKFASDAAALIVEIRFRNSELRSKLVTPKTNANMNNRTLDDDEGGDNGGKNMMEQMKALAEEAAARLEKNRARIAELAKSPALNALTNDDTNSNNNKSSSDLPQKNAAAASVSIGMSPALLLDMLEASQMETQLLVQSATEAADARHTQKYRAEMVSQMSDEYGASKANIKMHRERFLSHSGGGGGDDHRQRLESMASSGSAAAVAFSKSVKKGFWRADDADAADNKKDAKKQTNKKQN